MAATEKNVDGTKDALLFSLFPLQSHAPRPQTSR